MKKKKSLLRVVSSSLILTICAVIISCLLVEGLTRLMFPEWAPRTARLTKFWQYDPQYGWAHIPGTKGNFKSFGFDTEVSINSKGFRQREVSYARGNDVKRVVILGDSFVWGFGVQPDDMFVTQIEHRLPGVEVINLGVSGYSTDQELLLYQDEGRKYKPDLVVVMVAVNDIASNVQSELYLIYGKPIFSLREGKLELVNQPVAPTSRIKRAFVSLAWRSYFLTQLSRVIHRSTVTQARAKVLQPGTNSSSDSNVRKKNGSRSLAKEVTIRLLVKLKQATKADGAEFLVVFVDGFNKVATELADMLNKQDVDSLDLGQYIDVGDESMHLPDGMHWTPAGHKVVGKVLAERLKEQLLISNKE